MHYCLQEQIKNAKTLFSPIQPQFAASVMLDCCSVEQQGLVSSSQETTVLLPGQFPILFSLKCSQTVGDFYSYLLQSSPRWHLIQYNFFYYTIFKHSSTRRCLCGQRPKSLVPRWEMLTQFKLRFAEIVMAGQKPFCPKYQRPQHPDSQKVRMSFTFLLTQIP